MTTGGTEMTVPNTPDTQELEHWVFTHAGPVIRLSMAREFHYALPAGLHEDDLLLEVSQHPTVVKWLDLFGKGPIHASTNNAVENVFGRLNEFGLTSGDTLLDERVLPYLGDMIEKTGTVDRLLLPFLVRAGYTHLKEVRSKLVDRLGALDQGCSGSPSRLYLDPEERVGVPTAWKDRPVFRPETNPCGVKSAIPWVYDLHAIAFCPDDIPGRSRIIQKILAFVMTDEFQSAPDKAVIWQKENQTCYSCPILRLPGFLGFDGKDFDPKGFLMMVEALSRVPFAAGSQWMAQSITHLEHFRTSHGTYKFPSPYLPEKETYYLYQGGCMGLCEDRKNRNWIEIESTFRMIRLKRNLARGLH